MNADFIVVGGGLFGSIVATALRKRKGASVMVLDAAMPQSGMAAAGCVIRPSWITALPGEDAAKALRLLDEISPLHDRLFWDGNKFIQGYSVDPAKIKVASRPEQVMAVSDNKAIGMKGHSYNGRVIVTAGVWSGGLVQMPKIKALGGLSLTFRKTEHTTNGCFTYAPYKQAVWFDRKQDEYWFGDGTAIQRENYEGRHSLKTLERAKGYGLSEQVGCNYGLRPYVEGQTGQGYFKKHSAGLYVLSGGAKNGSVLAAYLAQKLIDSL